MKHLTILIASLFIFNSCSDEPVGTATNDSQGKWTLVKMSGSMANSETTGAAMEWQEFYLFKADGTFSKTREWNAVKTTISGTYVTTTLSNEKYLELTYPNDNEIIGNCYGTLKETLHLIDNNSLSSGWKACDGPGLEYKKI
jgi:hypothetical protein